MANTKANGVIRCTDNLGRLVIPKEIRKSLGLLPGEPVLMTFRDDKVIIEKYRDTCFLCGKHSKHYYEVHGKNVCQNCKELLCGGGDDV